MEDRGFVTMPIEDQLEDMTRSTSKRAEIANFPTKLHFMLSEMERDGLDHIAGWQPHGRAFTVKNTKEFETKILPW